MFLSLDLSSHPVLFFCTCVGEKYLWRWWRTPTQWKPLKTFHFVSLKCLFLKQPFALSNFWFSMWPHSYCCGSFWVCPLKNHISHIRPYGLCGFGCVSYCWFQVLDISIIYHLVSLIFSTILSKRQQYLQKTQLELLRCWAFANFRYHNGNSGNEILWKNGIDRAYVLPQPHG